MELCKADTVSEVTVSNQMRQNFLVLPCAQHLRCFKTTNIFQCVFQLHMQRCHKENMEGQEEAMVYDPDYLGFDLQPEPSGLFDASLFAKYLARETMGSLGDAQPTGSTQLVKLEPGMASTSDDSGVCSDPTNSPENGSSVSEPLQLPPVVQLARYGGIPFCLARKNSGIQLNCQKKGKKPNRWFMDISLMTAEDAERHREYLRRKENGLLPQKRQRKKAGKRITKGRSRTNAWQPKPSTSGLKGGKVKAKRPQKHRRVMWDNREEDTDEEEAYRLAQELMVKLEKQNVSDSGKAKPQRVSGRSKKKASSLKMLPSSASTLPHKTVGVKTSSSSAGMAAGTATRAVDHSEAGMSAKRQASTSDCSGSKAASLRRRSKSAVKKKPSQSGKKVLKKPAAGKNTGVQTLAWKKKLSGVSSLLYVNVKEEPREVRNAPASALSPFAVSHYNTTVAATNTQCWLNALLAGAARGCHGNALVDGGTKAASAALVRGTHFDDLKEEFFVKGLQLKERRHRDGVNENGVVLSTTSSSSTIPPQGETPFLDDPNVHVTSEGKDSNAKTDSVVSAVNLQGFGQVLAPAAEGASDSDIWQATTECLLGVLEAVSAEQLQVHIHPAVLTMPYKDLEFNDGDTVEENVSLPSHGVTGESKENGPLLLQPTVVEEDMEVEDRYHSAEELVPRRSRASSQSLDPTESSQGTRRFHFAADVEVDKDRVTPQEVQQPQSWSVSKEGGSTAQSHSVKNPSSCKLQKSSFDPFLSTEEDSEGISMSETLCEAEKNVCEEQSLESSFALPEIIENITEVNYSERELLSDVDAANTSSAALQESEDMLQSEEISPSESISAEMQLETNMTESGTAPSEVSAPRLSRTEDSCQGQHNTAELLPKETITSCSSDQTEDSCQGQHNTAELLPKETITNCSSDHVQEGSTSLCQTVGDRQGGSSSAYSLSRKKTPSSGMKGDGLSKAAESLQEERLPTESPPADDTPSTCSVVGVKDAAAQNSLDGAMLTKSHPVTSTKTGTSELQQLVKSSQEEAVKKGQCEPLPSRNNSEEHFEAPLASLQSDLENKTKPVPGMNEPAAVCDSLSERVQTRSSGMLEKYGNQERVCDLSKCLHVLVADIRTNPLALNSLQRFGVSTAYLDVSPTTAQRNTEEPPKRESGKKNKQATAKPKVSPRNASRAAKSSPKKKSTASRVTGKGADAASSSSASAVDAENANAAGIGGLLLATATVAKQGGSPAKTSPKFKEQTGKGKALASKASTQKKSKRKPRKVGRPRKRAGNRIAKGVGHDKVLEHDEEHCHVEGQHFVEGSSPVEGHSHADSHIDEHSHDEGHGHVEGQGHVDEHSHIDGHSHVEGQGHVDEQSHTDGHGHVEGHSHVDEHLHIARHSHVEGQGHVDEHSHIDGHSHVEGQGHVDEQSHTDGHSHVEGHSYVDEHLHIARHSHVEGQGHVDEQSHIDGHSHVEEQGHVDEQSHTDGHSHVEGHSHVDEHLHIARHSHVDGHSHIDRHSHVEMHSHIDGHCPVEGHSPVEGMTDELVEGASSSPVAIKLEFDEPATDERFLMVGVVDYESTAMTIDNHTTNSQESTGADSPTASGSKTLTSRDLSANNRKSVSNKTLPTQAPETDKQHADKGSSTTKPPRTKTAKKSRRSASKETVAATSPKQPKRSRKPAHISGMDTDIEEAQACPETTDNGGDLPPEPSTVGHSDKGKPALDTSLPRIAPSAAVASPRKSERARKVRQPVTHPHSTEVIENIKTLLHNKPGAKLPAGLKRLGILTSYQQASAKKEVVLPSVAKRLPGNSAALRSSTKMVKDPPMQHDKAAAAASVSEKKADSATGEEARDRVGMEPMSLDSTEDASLQPSLMDPSADDGGKDQPQKAVAASGELCHISPEMPRTEGDSDTSSKMEGSVCKESFSSPADRELALTEEGASRKQDSSVTDSEFRLAEGDVNGKPDSPITDSEFRLAEGDVNGKPDSPVTDSEFRLAEGDVKEKTDSPVIANEFRLAEGDVSGKPVSPVTDREFRLTEVSVNEEPVSASDSKLGPTEVGVNEKQVSVLDSGPGLTESASEEPVLSTVDRGLWLVEGGINKEPVSSVDHGIGLAEEVPVSSAVDRGLGLAEGGANEGPVSSAVGRGLGLAEGGANEGPVSSAADRGLGLAKGGADEGPVSCAADRGLGLAEGGANEVPVSCAADRGLGLAEGGVTVSEEPVSVLDCGLGLAESDGNKEPVFSSINSGLGLAARSANEEPTSSVIGNDLGLAAGGESRELVPVLDQGLGLAEGVNEELVSSVFDPGLGVAEEGANKEPVSYVLGLGPADGDVNEEPVSSVLDHGLRLTRGGVNTEPVSVLGQGLGLAEGGALDKPVPSVLDQGLGLAEGGALDKPVPSVLDQGLGLAEGGALDKPVPSVLDQGLGLAEGGALDKPVPSVLDQGLGLAEGGALDKPVPSVLDQGLGLAEGGATDKPVPSVLDQGLGLAEGGVSKEAVSILGQGLGLAEGSVNEEPVSSVLGQGLGLAEGSVNEEPVSSVLGQGLGLAEGSVNEEPVSSVLGQGLGLAEGSVNEEPVSSVLGQGLGLAEGSVNEEPVSSVLGQGLGLAEGSVNEEPVSSVLGQGLGLAEGSVNEEPVSSVLGQGLGLAEGSVNEEPVSSVLDCGAEMAERGIDQDTSSSAVDHSRDASPEKSTGNLVTVAQRKVFSVEIQAAIRKANTGQAESSPALDGCAVSPLPSERHARFSGRTLRNKSTVSGSSNHQQNPVLSDETPADTAIVASPADVTSESSPRNKARKVFRKQKGKSKALKRLNAKRKFGARGNVNDTEKRACSGTASRGENKAHHQLWAKIKQAQARSTKRTAKSAMKQTATAAEVATKTAVKKSKNSAFKIIKPCGKTSSQARKEPGMGVSRKRKRFMYVETDMGESPDPPCKKRGRPPGPKIILDRSQANLCFKPAQLLPGPGPVDTGLVDEASSFGAEVPSWLLTQAGTLAPSFAEGGLCIVPSQSNSLIYTVLPPPSAQSPPPGDAAAVPVSSEAHQLQISISAPEEYAALQLNDLEMPDIKPVLSQLSESAFPDVKPLIDELKHMNSSSPPQLLNEMQVSGATGLMWNEQPLPLPAESSKSQEDLGHLDEAGAAQGEASTSGPAESECSAPGKSQHVQSTLTSQHQQLRHVVGRRHKIRRRKKKDRLFSAQVRYKEAVGVSYDGDRRRSRRPKKSRLTDEEMRMAQDSPTSDLESEERALTSECSHPLDGNDEDAGSDIEFVSADYSHVDFSAQRLFLENLRVETFPFGELGDGQEAMEMFSQGEISELDTAGEQGDLDMAGEASNSSEFVTDEVGFGEMMSCPEFDNSPEEGGILEMESGPQADMELAASNEKLELVEAAGFGIEAHVPRVPCVKAEDSLVGQVYPNLDGIEEISEPLTDIEAMQSDVMKHPPWAHAEECTLKTEETEEYPAGSRCNCMDSESDCESKYRTTDHCLAVRGAHPIIKEEVTAELSSEIATQCISPELPHPQLQAFTPGSKRDDGLEVSVMENVEAGCAQSLKHEADVSDIGMGMLVPDTPPSSRMHVPVGLGTALEGSPSLTIFVKTSEGRGVQIQDDPKNVIKDEFAQNN